MVNDQNEKQKGSYQSDRDELKKLHELEDNGNTEAIKEFVGKLSHDDWVSLSRQMPYFHKGILAEIRYEFKREHNRIKGIPVAYENEKELSRLISFLNDRDYTGHLERSGPKVVYLHCDSLTYHRPNVTVMACWCSGRKRYPLSVDQFIENYIRIVIDDDVDLYNELIGKRYEERLHSEQK